MPIPFPGRTVESLQHSTVFVSSEPLRSSSDARRRGQRTSSGSAIALTDGMLVTNAHVAEGADLLVESWDGKSIRPTVIRVDRGRDMALLHAPGLNALPAMLGDSDSLRPGSPVIAVGNPLGFRGAVSTGIVHSIGHLGENFAPSRKWIYADVRLAPGNSGGPLADWQGRVVGINTMVSFGGRSSGGLALAIPSRAVQAFLANKKRGRLGVSLRAVQRKGHGFVLLILEVATDGPAALASLLPGDMLAGINGKRLRHMDDLEDALGENEALIHLEFVRGGDHKLRRVAVQVGFDSAVGAGGQATAAA